MSVWGGGRERFRMCVRKHSATHTRDNESKSEKRCLGLEKMHLGFWEVDVGINATGTNDLGGVGGGGLARGAFHAETAARPATSDAVVP
jgi:hypothetical protein